MVAFNEHHRKRLLADHVHHHYHSDGHFQSSLLLSLVIGHDPRRVLGFNVTYAIRPAPGSFSSSGSGSYYWTRRNNHETP